MNALGASMNTLKTRMMIGCAAILCGMPLAAALADNAPGVVAPTPSVWVKHEYRFSYFGFTSTYSCDGLADKLKLLLLTAGARADAKAAPAACARGFGRPDKFASAYLTFYTLAPPGADQPADSPTVDGTWRDVKIMRRKPFPLETGDCELIEQFRNNVLPMFTVRDLDDKVTCVPHQISGSSYSLVFQSLAALPKPVAVKAK